MPWRGRTFPGLEWGVAHRALGGAERSGDAYIIRSVPHGVLVAVVDGVGHGTEAANAAERAVQLIERSDECDVSQMVRRCHQTLIGTRGVVMSVVQFDLRVDSMTWLGVGNVVGSLWRANPAAVSTGEGLLTRGGVVGLRLPSTQTSVSAVAPGDVIVMFTDGLHPRLADHLSLDAPLQEIADRLLLEHGRETDDALVFIGRYLGKPDSDA